MRVEVYSVIRNERYLLPHFLRHYEQFADRIVLLDDRSDDGTREIARAHPKVTLCDYPFLTGLCEADLSQAYRDATRLAATQGVDWVLCPDADEFLYHPEMRMMLEAERAHGARAIGSYGLLCGADAVPETEGPLWEACPHRKPHLQYNKTLILDPALDWTLSWGRHRVELPEGEKVCHTGVILFHCCYLSPAYTRERITKNFARMPDGQMRGEERDYRIQRAMRHAFRRMTVPMGSHWPPLESAP